MFFKRRPDFGFYTRYYDGEDYYNINFEQKLTRFEFGATFSWESILRAMSNPL